MLDLTSWLLNSLSSELQSAGDVSYIKLYGMFFSPGVRGGSWGGGWGKENSYQPKRTAARARVLPSLTTHISSKCALDVAFSNPNKKPGEKMILWLVLFSIPWNICRRGDPSPDFFFQPCKMATCLFNRHVCIHVATYFLSRPSFLSFPFPPIFAICTIFLQFFFSNPLFSARRSHTNRLERFQILMHRTG